MYNIYLYPSLSPSLPSLLPLFLHDSYNIVYNANIFSFRSVDQEEKDADQSVMTEEEAFELINLTATIIQSHVARVLGQKETHAFP